MLIGVFSDTHDNVKRILEAVIAFEKAGVESIIHCGDWVKPATFAYFISLIKEWKLPVRSVFDNNEDDKFGFLKINSLNSNPVHFPPDFYIDEFTIDGHKALLYHGQNKRMLKRFVDSRKYKVIFTGHTHRAEVKVVRKTLVLNPG